MFPFLLIWKNKCFYSQNRQSNTIHRPPMVIILVLSKCLKGKKVNDISVVVYWFWFLTNQNRRCYMTEILPIRRITLSNQLIKSKAVNDSITGKINEKNRTYGFYIVCIVVLVLHSRSSRRSKGYGRPGCNRSNQ